MPDTFSVVALNLHNERTAARWVHGHRAPVAIVSEAQRVLRPLRHGARITTGRRAPGRNMPQEVAVVLDARLPNLGETTEFLSPEWPPAARVAPDKYGHVAITELIGVETAFLGIHPPAGPEALAGLDPSNEIVKRYRDCMEWLDTQLSYHLSRNRAVVVGGDLNMTERVHRDWSPYRLFRRYDMTWYAAGLDAVAWSHPFGVVSRDVVLPHVHGSNHPAVVVELTRRRKP